MRSSRGPSDSDANVTVKAFPVHHGEALQSFGYRFETKDRTIVISGDTTPVQSLLDNCRDCDVLIHEAYSMETYRQDPPSFQEFRRGHHTSSLELAEIANTVKPGLLVTYHHSTSDAGPTGSDRCKRADRRDTANLQRQCGGRPQPGCLLSPAIRKQCSCRACPLRVMTDKTDSDSKRAPLSGRQRPKSSRQGLAGPIPHMSCRAVASSACLRGVNGLPPVSSGKRRQ